MNKPVARIVTRLQGEGDGLFLGALFQGGREFFEPNTVYEIRETMGELSVVKIGKASGAGPDNCSSRTLKYHKVQFTWCSNISDVIELGASAFLTEAEYLSTLETQE